jgi:hypothetical protein
MNFKRLPISALNAAPYNPRIPLKPGDVAWQKLERSLDEFDLVQPIVWNERTGHVVAGHQRLTILKHRGQEAIDCVVVDLPLEKEKALNVTLNNSSVGSDWDAGKLVELVAELQDLPDFDATLTGFDEQQLKDLVLTPCLDPEEPARCDDDSDGRIQVTLEVPGDCWEVVREDLDTLLASHSGVRMHLRQGSLNN